MNALFLHKQLDGIGADEGAELSLLHHDIVTEADIRGNVKLRATVLAALREAAKRGDMDRVQELDSIYDEIQEIIEQQLENWPEDYAPSCLDECHL